MIDKIRSKTVFICDMGGVIYHGNQNLNVVKEFVAWLKRKRKICFLNQFQLAIQKRTSGEINTNGN